MAKLGRVDRAGGKGLAVFAGIAVFTGPEAFIVAVVFAGIVVFTGLEAFIAAVVFADKVAFTVLEASEDAAAYRVLQVRADTTEVCTGSGVLAAMALSTGREVIVDIVACTGLVDIASIMALTVIQGMGFISDCRCSRIPIIHTVIIAILIPIHTPIRQPW